MSEGERSRDLVVSDKNEVKRPSLDFLLSGLPFPELLDLTSAIPELLVSERGGSGSGSIVSSGEAAGGVSE
jgi:hypothetical protein